MSTTTSLAEELEQAAPFLEASARRWRGDNQPALAEEVDAAARRLHQRAAWVRELEAKAANEVLLRQQGGDERGECIFGAVVRWLARLTGPIPAAETAPTERKEP